MYPSFDPFEYAEYLRRRWVIVAVACSVAILVALPLAMLLPKRYTATATVVIDPPAGSDVRTLTAVSPIYLESLKSYERYAESDSLFARAAERFHLRDGGSSIESLKRRALKVTKVRDTRILEISATLQDPKLAQGLAQYLAEETVNMSHGDSIDVDRELVDQAQKQVTDAQTRLEGIEQSLSRVSASSPIDTLQSEIEGLVELENKVRQELVEAEASVAEYQQQPSGQFEREQLQAAKARASVLEKRAQELERSVREKSALRARLDAKKAELENQLKMAQTSYDGASARLREVRSASGTRGERLRVMDPGIVPQRPSSPNVPLIVTVALFAALVASIVYLSFAFVFRRRSVGFEPAVTRGMRA